MICTGIQLQYIRLWQHPLAVLPCENNKTLLSFPPATLTVFVEDDANTGNLTTELSLSLSLSFI